MAKKNNKEIKTKNIDSNEEEQEEVVNPWDAMWGFGENRNDEEVSDDDSDDEYEDETDEDETEEDENSDPWFKW
ncbi:hypothetical protein [Alkalihalobacillus sp. TS-13]|uniref:hypothetical protein n=1 Tax=Alkalihalobacillus sp. TS-13 TaxID=2842455 RepID=UPI001C88CC6A|nr:hypothetical protein [Alkalihalobacillus sp. TS-13]